LSDINNTLTCIATTHFEALVDEKYVREFRKSKSPDKLPKEASEMMRVLKSKIRQVAGKVSGGVKASWF